MLPEFFAIGQKLGLDKEALMAMDIAVIHEWLEWGKILNVPVQRIATIKELDGRTQGEANDTNSNAQAPLPSAATAAHSFTILIADSDPATRSAIERLLSTTGAVHVAINGAQAMDIVAKAQPDLILADWALPGLSGETLLKNLRSSQEGKEKYVIVLTAHDNEQTLVAAFDAGADDYVTKPFGARSLEARVRAGQRIVALKQEVKREMREVQRYIQELAAVNQRWEEAAFTDVLTGLPNRRYAMERLKQEWAGSVRNNRPLSCMMIDIDYFKHVNDTYGHAGGDRVLRSIATVLKKSIRTEDVICRVGGEEFLVICSDTTEIAAASGAGERLNKAVANHVVTNESGFNARVTISIGVAGRSPANSTVDAVLKAADRAVYEAKNSGRNRVCLAK
jgi:diguanylate cyclase (GGDEF)-like protein